MNGKQFPLVCILGAIGVVLGALGAHALKTKLNPEQLASFETGVRYQLIHVVVLLMLTLGNTSSINQKLAKYAYNAFLVGIFLFSGSIYILSTKDITQIPFYKVFGPITPLGGITIIIGWGLLAAAAIKRPIKYEQ